MNNYSVSVVIPTYNRPHLLVTALNSVFAQTHQPQEIIVIDDGSVVDTHTCIKEIIPTSPIPLYYCRIPHSGKPSVARNTGCKMARSTLVAFLDDDDQWLPQKLDSQINLHRTHKVLFSHTKEIWVRNGAVVTQPRPTYNPSGDIFKAALHKCIVGPSTMLFGRDFITDLGGFNEELEIAEDYELVIRASLYSKAGYIDKPLILKTGGHQQLSKKYEYIELFRIKALNSLLKNPHLTSVHKASIGKVLAHKCTIWAKGCTKRGKHTEAQRYYQYARDIDSA